jgi:OPA family glycerol-3-phosphate transporter-like MFS transporter
VSATAIRRSRLGEWQRLNVSLLVLGYTGYYLCRSNFSVTMPLLIAELRQRGVSAAAAQITLGSIASLGVLAYAIGKFPSGNLADRIGGKRNFLFGMGGSIAFTIAFALSGGVPLFTLAWMGNRLVQSLGWAGAVKVVSRWFPFRQYGTVMACISLSYLFGDALARQFMAWLIATGQGWRGVFLISAGVLATVLAVCRLLLRESPAEVGEPEPQEDPSNLFAQRSAADRAPTARELLVPLLANGTFWLSCALSLGTTILRETLTLWTPTYFTQSAGMTASDAARASAVFPLFGGVSVLLCGWMSDRLGRGGRAAIISVGLMCAAVGLLMLGFGAFSSPNSAVVLVGAVAFLLLGPYSFLAGAISLDFGGKQGSGTASGLIDGIGYLGGVISGGSIARISVDHGWSGAFLVLAAVATLSSIVAGVLLRRVVKSANHGLD